MLQNTFEFCETKYVKNNLSIGEKSYFWQDFFFEQDAAFCT